MLEVGTLYKQVNKELPASHYMDVSYQEAALKELGRVPEDLTIR